MVLFSALVIVWQHCLKKLIIYIRDSHQSKHVKLAKASGASGGTTTENMKNAESNYTLCLKHTQTKYVPIALSVHAFKKLFVTG